MSEPASRPPELTIGAVLTEATRRLRCAGGALGASPRLDVALLLAAAADCPRSALLARSAEPLAAGVSARFEAALARRLAGEPIAYVLGEAWFYGRPFAVDARVLVPRPETEHLADAALDELSARLAAGRTDVRACDVGTGSGALAVTLALESPQVAVYASETCGDALAVARANAARHGARVCFVLGDLAVPLAASGPYDLVVANLPYIPSAALPVRPEPAGFEPVLALDGGADGLDLYRRLFVELPELLRDDGTALCEAAPGTIEALAELAEHTLPGAFVEIADDYAGLPRYVSVGRGRPPS